MHVIPRWIWGYGGNHERKTFVKSWSWQRIKFLDDYYRQFIHKVVKNGCYLCHVCLHSAMHGFSWKLIWGSVTKIFQKIEVCLTTDTSNRLTSHSHEDLNKFMHISYCILLYWVKFQVKGVEKIKRHISCDVSLPKIVTFTM